MQPTNLGSRLSTALRTRTSSYLSSASHRSPRGSIDTSLDGLSMGDGEFDRGQEKRKGKFALLSMKAESQPKIDCPSLQRATQAASLGSSRTSRSQLAQVLTTITEGTHLEDPVVTTAVQMLLSSRIQLVLATKRTSGSQVKRRGLLLKTGQSGSLSI